MANRSHYGETLVVRVHPDFLNKQKITLPLITKDVGKDRFRDHGAFERYHGHDRYAGGVGFRIPESWTAATERTRRREKELLKK
jgi:hypothetical protein